MTNQDAGEIAPRSADNDLAEDLDRLRPLMLRLLSRILTHLADELKAGTFPTRRSSWYTPTGGGHWENRQETRLDVGIALAFASKHIQEFPEFASLLEVLRDSYLVDRLLPDSSEHDGGVLASSLWQLYVLPFVADYFESNGFGYSDDLGGAFFETFRAALLRTSFTHEVVAPLAGVTGDFDELQIDEFTRIRRLTESELRRLWDLSETGFISRLSRSS